MATVERLLEPFRQVVYYWDGRYAVHRFGTPYIRVERVSEDTFTIGFEDLDEELGYTPDWDYENPRIRVVLVDRYMLVYVARMRCGFPVAEVRVFYGFELLYLFSCPTETAEPQYLLLDPEAARVVHKAAWLTLLLRRAPVVPAWGFPLVRVGTTMRVYATAEGPGMLLRILVRRPDGSVEEGVMEDLGDGNYAYTVRFDVPGEYLIEIVYPDGFKRKKVVIAE